MLTRTISFGVGVLFLSGCLLTQQDPGKNLQKGPFLLGSVSVEDMRFANQGQIAELNASFRFKEDVAEPVGLATIDGRAAAVRKVLSAAQDRLAGKATRAADCEKQQYRLVPAGQGTKPKEVELVDVGPIGFGVAMQSDIAVLKPDEKKRYGGHLTAGLPAGIYNIISDGNDKVSRISELLSMPEHVFDMRINGRDFDYPFHEMKTNDDLELFWREPTIANSVNVILLEVSLIDGDKQYVVSCGLPEANIPGVKGFKEWNLDKAWFREFPKAGKVGFNFVRAHLRKSEEKNSTISLYGMRTLQASIEAK